MLVSPPLEAPLFVHQLIQFAGTLHVWFLVVLALGVFTWRIPQWWRGELTSPLDTDKEHEVWVIHGKRYNFVDFMKHHPGGSFLLRVAQGSDCTGLWESYHIFADRARMEAILKKYELPDELPVGRTVKPLSVKEAGIFGCPFHEDLKKMCREHFAGKGKHAHKTKASHVAFHQCLLVIQIFGIYGMVWNQRWDMCILVSLSSWHLLSNAAHDASHFAYSASATVNRVVSAAGWPFGFNSTAWHLQHVAQHHVYTNDAGDVDLYHFMPLVRLSKRFNFSPVFRFQNIVFFALLSPTAIGHLNIVVPFDILWGTVDPLTMEMRYEQAQNIKAFRKVTFWQMLFEFVSIPAFVLFAAMHSGHSVLQILPHWCFCMALTSVQFLFCTQVTHLQASSFGGLEYESWAKRQVASSHDYSQASRFWSLFTGGLNMQALHHVLPGISSSHYYDMYPKFRDICKKHDVQIKEFSSAWATFVGFYSWLVELSTDA